jgi:hypothetical protein
MKGHNSYNYTVACLGQNQTIHTLYKIASGELFSSQWQLLQCCDIC